MSDYNHVGFLGRVTQNAEIIVTEKGFTIVSFSVAVNRDHKNSSTSEWVSTPSFFNLRLYGKRATALHPYLQKGQPVIIGGHLEQRTWEKDGEKRSNIEIVVDTINLVGFMRSKSPEESTENPILQELNEEQSEAKLRVDKLEIY